MEDPKSKNGENEQAEQGEEAYGGDPDAEPTATEGKSEPSEPSERDQAEG